MRIILDYDGFPHDADTGERTIGDNERPGHWMDELPAINLTGLVLITSPNDMVMTPAGRWVRRISTGGAEEAQFGRSSRS